MYYNRVLAFLILGVCMNSVTPWLILAPFTRTKRVGECLEWVETGGVRSMYYYYYYLVVFLLLLLLLLWYYVCGRVHGGYIFEYILYTSQSVNFNEFVRLGYEIERDLALERRLKSLTEVFYRCCHVYTAPKSTVYTSVIWIYLTKKTLTFDSCRAIFVNIFGFRAAI